MSMNKKEEMEYKQTNKLPKMQCDIFDRMPERKLQTKIYRRNRKNAKT